MLLLMVNKPFSNALYITYKSLIEQSLGCPVYNCRLVVQPFMNLHKKFV